ncbi:hypothetical protein [Sphingomonas sp.]|uniref:hypothetical protein n=1 Tax=Sphingomonas sp. TaxID=28214 RepID=UPI001B2D1796|nr:hypothetical protein [Sphingomonas sp.]MBO9712255.1 hypothetical protein [Sphingomonas sp.]
MIRESARLLLAGAFILGGTTFLTSEASAQATRTWVSGVGDDVNPCSRTAPCKTFAGAISKTAAGGEINCIDPGGFGAVTITKSMTIICDEVGAGVLVSGTNGFIINDGGAGTAVVTISGIDIEGIGYSTGGSGIRGVWFISGAALTVRNSIIRNFRDTSNGSGITFSPSGAAKLVVDNVTLSGNGNTGVGGGIVIQPTGTGSAKASIVNTRSISNTNNGLLVNTTGNTGPGNLVTVTGSNFDGNSASGVAVVTPASTTGATVTVLDSSMSNNARGASTNGGTAVIRIGRSVIAGNSTSGVFANAPGASLGVRSFSPASNALSGNTADGTFTGTDPYQ